MELFTQLAIVVFLAAFLGVLMDKLKQPALLGYIIAGWIVASLGAFRGDTEILLQTFSEVGVTLLLFLVGMEMSWPKLKAVGKAALGTGIGQIVFTTLGGLLLAYLMGFEWRSALYIAIALTFSSTIIIVKLLSEKNDLHSLHGRIAVGMLLVQDFAAILLLVMLTGLGEGSFNPLSLTILLFKFALLIVVIIFATKYLIPKLVDFIAHSTELLFITSVAWGIGLAALLGSPLLGLSIEVGGFLAGITLAGAIEQHQILSRLRPLRDFFIMLFFVYLGSGLTFSGINGLWVPVMVFSLFVLLGNPLIVMFIMRHLNYRARTSFMTSLTVAQISEFSLIVIALGQKLGHVPNTTLGVVTLVGALTMTGSTYMILGADKLWRKYGGWLKKMEKRGSRDSQLPSDHDWKDHIILIGCHRTGQVILNQLLRKKQPVVVVDFDPEIVKTLSIQGVDIIYGDVEDVDNLQLININQAKMVISTVPDKEATLMLLEYLRTHPRRGQLLVIVTADYPQEKTLFLANGADYVAIPREMTGQYLAEIISKAIHQGKQAITDQVRSDKSNI